MRKPDVARRCFVLTLTMVGLLSWNTLPPQLAGRAVAAATRTDLTRLADQPVSRAMTNGKIAFTSDRDGNQEIYLMNADGSNQVRLTNNPGTDSFPAFSPDGRRIAFVSQNASGAFAVKLMNADGTNQIGLTPIDFFNSPYPWHANSSLSWSPDGGKIAFDDNGEIFTVNVDGSNRTNLTNHPASDIEPAWSADGSRILFVSSRVFYLTLHTMNADGSDVRALPSAGELWDMSPDWSPTGNKIAFVVHSDVSLPILYTANADGTNRQIFDGCGDGLCSTHRNKPKWSPDGTKIVFHIWEYFSNDAEIYVKNVDGGGFAQLTNTNGRNYHPSWQPLSLTSPACANPIECAEFFVRQHYRDFLNREPEQSGLDDWLRVLHNCPSGDAECLHQARLTTSASFFGSPEFQLKGYFVFRFYRAAFDRLPAYDEIIPDMQSVSGQTPAEVYAAKTAFTNAFTQRPGFVNDFGTLTNAAYVTALLSRYQLASITTPDPAAPDGAAKVTLTPADLVARLDSNSLSRAQVLRAIADSDEVFQLEFNRAFVAMQYYGYLRRTPEVTGYNAWLNYLNAHPTDAREMVRGFVDSVEYRARFGQP